MFAQDKPLSREQVDAIHPDNVHTVIARRMLADGFDFVSFPPQSSAAFRLVPTHSQGVLP